VTAARIPALRAGQTPEGDAFAAATPLPRRTAVVVQAVRRRPSDSLPR
jgi:hypothetical protein